MAKKKVPPEKAEKIRTKDFFDCIAPSIIKFLSDYYIVGDSYRCVWAVREYPPSTEEQALFSRIADKNGVTLRIYHRLVEPMEQRKIIQNATRKNKLKSGGNDITETVEAAENLQDVIELLANIRKSREVLLHASVFIELKAKSLERLKDLQAEVFMELAKTKVSVDRLTLRQREGFLSVLPWGENRFGELFERVMPVSSAANFYPFSFSGKTDPQGLYIGRDKFGSNILVDFDRRTNDKTTSNILVLGNSGQGKSYLLKLLLINIRESGKQVICLDPDDEYKELCEALGGSYIDFLSGEYKINPLEPKAWTDNVEDSDEAAPEAFRKVTRLSQHIAFLKDFFRSYKDFTDAQIDTIEILLAKLYDKFGVTDNTDYTKKAFTDFPVMEDFYKLCEEEYHAYDKEKKYLYTEETLQEVCLGIHSMCVGAESKYFNGHTNVKASEFVCFGVKGLLDTNKRLKDAMLFNNYLNKKRMKNNGKLPIFQVEETHEPIIDLATFKAVQAEMARRVAMQKKPKGRGRYAFTGLIKCENCGKSYRRKTTATQVVWICSTYNVRGKGYCSSKRIPETTLEQVSAEFDLSAVKEIKAANGNKLTFVFKDGREEIRYWKDRSRAEVWTEERRQKARENAYRRIEKCQKLQ